MEVFEQFTGMYPLSKCLGFKLDPAEQTKNKECLQKLIEADKKLAEDAEKMKEMIDRYHRQFIQKCLSNFELKLNSDGKKDSLEDYWTLISKRERESKENKQFNDVKSNLRKSIVDAFKKGATYKDLSKKELIQKHLIHIAKSEEERSMIEKFKNFNTYFKGFYKNRENMYSDEEKSTAIAYRLINENLPIFCNNMIFFEKIKERNVIIDIDLSLPKDINSISEIFELSYFTKLLVQDSIKKYNDIVSKINENVNLYNQQQGNKKNRLPLFKKLKRMILSDKVAVSWLPEKFSSDKEMIDAINKAIDNIRPILDNNSDKSLKFLLQHIGDYDLSRIYIYSKDLPYISKCMFDLNDVFTNRLKAKKRSNRKRLSDKSVDNWFKSCKSFSIEELNTVEGETGTNTIENYFANLKVYDREEKGNDVDIFEYINRVYTRARDILAGKHKDLNKSDDDIKRLKDLFDAFKTLQRLVKPLFGNGDEVDKDNEFYAKLNTAWDALSPITPLYDMVRNWLVRKPYSTKKITLNFGYSGNLLNGWSDNQTKSDLGTQYGGYLFRRKNGIGEYDYYLGISFDSYLFRTPCEESERGENNYERLNYYQIKKGSFCRNSYNGDYSGDKERLIVVIKDFISASTDNNFKKKALSLKKPTEYIKFLKDYDYTIYENLLADKEFQKENATFINKMKNAFRSISRIPKAQEFANKQYALFTEVMDDMETLLLERIFEYFPVSEKKMKEAIEREEKALYLFKITNKDLSFADSFIAGKRKREKRGRDNLHTMYFKALMSGEKDVFDLGTGEVFFREKTEGLKIEPTHDANIPIRNKNKSVQERRPTSTFPYGLIKDKRYTEDIFQFHLSFVQNYKASTPYINPMVNEYLKSSKDTHIIGIDRGERNLLYYVVIDQKGNIIEQQSLNKIRNEIKKEDEITTDYHDLLEERAKDIREARRNWQTIESIKELKEGHLSQAIHKITELMIKYNAVVVLEYLNPDFIRSRQKREIQEYSKFERMLANKLQYLVDKKKDFHETGGVLKGFQLTNDIENSKDKNNQDEFKYQNGFLFYVPAWNTSKIDPVTGFVNLFDTRFKGEKEARDDFFSQFDSIRYNVEKDMFEFSFDYDKFTDKARGTQTKWTLCTYGKRIKIFRNPAKNNQWDDEEIVLTNEFKKAFADADIDINGNLKDEICSLTDKKCLEQLMHLMTLLLQMRNSETGTEIDYLLSPVADAEGNFYDSRKYSRKCIDTLPKDADANGAYNIARKGLWAIRKIQSTPSGERPKLAISNKEWLQFAQQKPYLDD